MKNDNFWRLLTLFKEFDYNTHKADKYLKYCDYSLKGLNCLLIFSVVGLFALFKGIYDNNINLIYSSMYLNILSIILFWIDQIIFEKFHGKAAYHLEEAKRKMFMITHLGLDNVEE